MSASTASANASASPIASSGTDSPHGRQRRRDGSGVHARVRVAGEEDDVVAEGEHAVVQGRVERARHRAGTLGIAPLQVGARDAVGEQGVAADECPVGEDEPGHVGRVAGQCDRADLDASEDGTSPSCSG